MTEAFHSAQSQWTVLHGTATNKKASLPVVVAKHEDFFSPVGFREVLVLRMRRTHDELRHAAEKTGNERRIHHRQQR